MVDLKPLSEPARRLTKQQFQTWLEKRGLDPKVIMFTVAQFEAAYDIIVLSIEKGGVPTKGDIIRFLGAKSLAFSGLSEDNRVACVSSIVSFGLTASTAPAAGAGGPAAWAWYIGAVLLDGLDIGGNCYLAYLDADAEAKLVEFRKQIDARRMWGHSNAKAAISGGESVNSALESMLKWQTSQPADMCWTPASSASPLR